MKKIVGFLLLALLASSSFAENNDRTMAFSISPIALLGGGIDAMYQYKLTEYLSLTVPANFYYSWFKTSLVGTVGTAEKRVKETRSPFDAQIGVGARFLMAQKGLNDTFYLEPRLLLGYEQFGVNVGDSKFEAETLTLTPMLRLGWDWYFDSGFYMSLGGGVGVNTYLNKVSKIPSKYKDNFVVGLYFPPQNRSFSLAWEGEFKLGYAL